LKEDLLGQGVRLRNPIPSARLSVQEILQEPTFAGGFVPLGPYLILVLLAIVAGVLILVAGKLFGL
jgi:hypothetical protein